MMVDEILKSSNVVAVVGLSANQDRPSYGVAAYLKEHGYKIIPVNPKEDVILGERCYPSLMSVDGKIDIVDIFCRSEEVEAIVDEAIKKGLKAVWMQEGVINDGAAKKARDAGLEVVMDMCIMKEHRKMIKEGQMKKEGSMPKTNDNVQAAFAGESQASRKYTYFAEKAEVEGLKQVARLFRAAAEAETVHARNHLRVIDGIKSTKENLAAAIGGEHHEFTEMYPGFIKQADAEGKNQAKRSFDMANQVEKIHHGLFQAILDKLNQGKVIDEKPIFVCQVCGNTVEGAVQDKCSVCGAPAKMFKQID